MNFCFQRVQRLLAIIGMTVFFCGTVSYGEEPVTKSVAIKTFYANIAVFSIDPQKGLSSYRGDPGGSAGPRATFGTSVACNKQVLDVKFEGRQKEERFLATLTVSKSNDDKGKREELFKRELDLTDLEPLSIEIARDDDGRVYRVTVVPSIREHPLPKVFKIKDLALERWGFQDSSVILNDQDYLGTLNMAGGDIGWVDIPGLAKVEFSLRSLKGAQQEGVLMDGVLTIKHRDTTIQINNVHNGTNGETLKGGPYHVFVRWQPPSRTIDQYRIALKQQIAAIKKQIESGDLEIPSSTLSLIESRANSDRIFLFEWGTGSTRKDDLDLP